MKDRQERNVRSRLSTKLKQKHQQTERDKSLSSLRKQETVEHEKNINIFDFMFSFGVLC